MSCYLPMAGQNDFKGRHRWMESACYPERRHRRRGQGRGRRLVAAWLGPAPILTGHHPPGEPCVHNFHPHVNRPHSRPPPPHPAGHKVPAPLLHPSLIFSSSESKQVKERRHCQPHKPGRNLQQATRPPCRLTYFHPTS